MFFGGVFLLFFFFGGGGGGFRVFLFFSSQSSCSSSVISVQITDSNVFPIMMNYTRTPKTSYGVFEYKVRLKGNKVMKSLSVCLSLSF